MLVLETRSLEEQSFWYENQASKHQERNYLEDKESWNQKPKEFNSYENNIQVMQDKARDPKNNKEEEVSKDRKREDT